MGRRTPTSNYVGVHICIVTGARVTAVHLCTCVQPRLAGGSVPMLTASD